MTYELFIGDRTYSSWSMRGWLMFEKFGLPFKVTEVGLYSGTMAEDMRAVAPARLVPAVLMPSGDAIGDTLAIAETLAERHPDAGLWPKDPVARMHARWLVAEMHSGFTALRDDCPMNIANAVSGFQPSEAVKSDLDRIQTLWSFVRERYANGTPWLFGDYSLADVFYAPVAMRIAGYGLPVGTHALDYVTAHLNDNAVRRWRALGLTKVIDPEPYSTDLKKTDWPGPPVLAAKSMESGPSENATCPYSGKPVSHFLELNDRVFGFCNATCRDKTVNDPEVWPDFMAIYNS